MNRPWATVSIDLDDLWAYRRSFGLAPASAASLLPAAVPRFLRLMDDHGIRGTAFVIGRDAEVAAHAPLLRGIAAAGHEIANHSQDHAPDLDCWPATRQSADLARAHVAIVAASGFEPRGFRAPSFRVSPTLLESVRALGYRYDSSTFPSSLGALARIWQTRRARALGTRADFAADAYGSGKTRRLPLHPFAWNLAAGGLIEVPVTTIPGVRLPMHGTYLHYLGDRAGLLARTYARLAVAACRQARVAPHFLLHATDFIGCDDGPECAFLPGMRRPWRAKVELLATVLHLLAADFTLIPIDDYVAQLGSAYDQPGRIPADLL